MRRVAALVLCAGLLTLAACGGKAGVAAPPDGQELWGTDHAPYPIDATPLTDTDGKAYSLASSPTKPLTLVFYGYTHCPDLCPLVMANLASAVTRLSAEDRAKVDVVFVTSDPGRDTGPVLRSYLDRYDPSFIGLTGKLADIVKVGESMKIYVGSGQKLPSGGYDLSTHDTHVSAVDGSTHQATVLWNMETSPAQFAYDIHTLLQKDAS